MDLFFRRLLRVRFCGFGVRRLSTTSYTAKCASIRALLTVFKKRSPYRVCLCPCLRTVGRSRCMFFFNSVTNLSVASLYLLASSSRNCPGSRSPFPFSLYAVLTPIRMTGNTSTQSVVSWHLMAAFNCLCSLSTMPFAAGWYAVVLMCFMPVILAI
ncbi:hypothetical protein PUN28_011884 [Cardiocondyla obscurior]|uniref:Uncharacterized protein n=1 Tax=Cardiocondyla obscurior TaxID=286306 RepID=A0AAW2FJL1_9HYME